MKIASSYNSNFQLENKKGKIKCQSFSTILISLLLKCQRELEKVEIEKCKLLKLLLMHNKTK